MGCGGSTAHTPHDAENKPEKAPQGDGGDKDAAQQQDGNLPQFCVTEEDGKESDVASWSADTGGRDSLNKTKSELRLMEISKTRTLSNARLNSHLHLLSPDGNGIVHSPSSPHRHRRSRRASTVRPFEESLKGLLEDPDSWEVLLDESEDAQLEAVFNKLGEQKNGTTVVTLENLMAGFHKMKWERSSKEIERMFNLSDTDGNGAIDLNEFKQFFRAFVGDGGACLDDEVSVMAKLPGTPRIAKYPTGEPPPRERAYEYGERPIRGYNVEYLDRAMPSGVKSVCCPRNQPLLAAADFESAIIHVFSLHDRRLVRIINGQSDGIISMATDKKSLVTTGRESSLVVSDMTVGCVIREFEHPTAVTCCAFPDGGKHIITGCQDNICRVFQLAKGKLIKMTDRLTNYKSGVIVSIACRSIEPKKTFAISRSHEMKVRIMSCSTFSHMHTLRGHTTTVWGLQYSSDGNRLLSHCDGLIKIWNPHQRKEASYRTFDAKKLAAAQGQKNMDNAVWTSAIFASADFEHVVIGVSIEYIFFLHVEDQSVLLALDCKQTIYSICSAHQENTLACGDEVGNIFLIEFW